ncbi:MAG: helix-turn-helix transcriptional regulator [Coprobacillus sp.]|nr:helix-turn-helix transcriptional regulator [Coprobacillus sp.]
MSVGENIRKIRKEKGLTQKQLSELSGVHEVQIRRYETNKSIMPKVETISKLAKALCVTTAILIDDEDWDILKQDEKTVKSFLSIAQNEHDEMLQSRKITNIIDYVKRLGYKTVTTADALLFYDSSSYKIITDKELLQLERESNDFLKFKLEELLKEKEEIPYKKRY